MWPATNLIPSYLKLNQHFCSSVHWMFKKTKKPKLPNSKKEASTKSNGMRSTFYIYNTAQVKLKIPALNFAAGVLMSCMQSASVPTCMDTIWDLNMNSSRSMSPSVPSIPWRPWQTHKGMNETVVSSQFPLAFPQRPFKRRQASLWLTAVCVERKAIRGQTSTLKTS